MTGTTQQQIESRKQQTKSIIDSVNANLLIAPDAYRPFLTTLTQNAGGTIRDQFTAWKGMSFSADNTAEALTAAQQYQSFINILLGKLSEASTYKNQPLINFCLQAHELLGSVKNEKLKDKLSDNLRAVQKTTTENVFRGGDDALKNLSPGSNNPASAMNIAHLREICKRIQTKILSRMSTHPHDALQDAMQYQYLIKDMAKDQNLNLWPVAFLNALLPLLGKFKTPGIQSSNHQSLIANEKTRARDWEERERERLAREQAARARQDSEETTQQCLTASALLFGLNFLTTLLPTEYGVPFYLGVIPLMGAAASFYSTGYQTPDEARSAAVRICQGVRHDQRLVNLGTQCLRAVTYVAERVTAATEAFLDRQAVGAHREVLPSNTEGAPQITELGDDGAGASASGRLVLTKR